MKNIKTFNNYINESLKGKLKGKTDEEIIKSLSKLDVYDRIRKVLRSSFDKKFLPSDEEIRKELNELDTFDRIRKINQHRFDVKFIPSDEEISKELDKLDTFDHINKIDQLGLDDKFMPSDDDIRKKLDGKRVYDVFYIIDNYGLDDKFISTEEDIKKEMVTIIVELTDKLFNDGYIVTRKEAEKYWKERYDDIRYLVAGEGFDANDVYDQYLHGLSRAFEEDYGDEVIEREPWENEPIEESLKDKLKGKSNEDILKQFINQPTKLLIKSTEYNFEDGIRIAIEKGADVNCDDGQPLKNVASNGNLEMVKFLIKNGADMYLEKGAPLVFAILSNRFNVIKYLISKGLNTIVTKESYILGLVRTYCDTTVLKYFLDNFEFSSDIIDENIHYAKLETKKEAIELLQEYKKKIFNKEIDDANDKLKKSYTNNDIKGFSNALSSRLCSQSLIDRLLIESSTDGKLKIMKKLLSHGANIRKNKTVLMNNACYYGNLHIVKFLIEKGIIPTKENSDIARNHFHSNISDYILNHINNSNESLKDKLKGKTEEDIIKNINKMNISDINKMLIWSCKNNYIEPVKKLIENGANPNYSSSSPLNWSVIVQNYDMVRFLLDNGADVRLNIDLLPLAKRIEGIKGIEEKRNKNKIISLIRRYILKDKLKLNRFNESLKDKLKGKSEDDIIKSFDDMNELLINSVKKNFFNGVKYALENGANVHYNDNYPLRRAVDENHLDIVKYLVDNGGDIHVNNDELLLRSSIRGNINMIKYFIKKGLNVHSNDNKPLKLASYHGHEDVVKYLLENFGYDLHTIENAIKNAKTGDYNNIVILLNQYIDKKELY
jgi:ankyrin repeat protein